MEIQQEINQKKAFATSHEKAMVNLIYTSNWFRDKQQLFFNPLGIRSQHYNVLRILKGRHPEPISPGDIKNVMLDKAPDLTRLLDKLDSLGYVKRNLSKKSRRKMDILITKSGLQFLQNINKKMDIVADDWLSKISIKEAEQLSHLLDKLRG